jgi:hypothetical protein
MDTSYLFYKITSFYNKTVRHVSVLYYGTIIRDLYLGLHKITKQQVMAHILNVKDIKCGFSRLLFVGPLRIRSIVYLWKARTVLAIRRNSLHIILQETGKTCQIFNKSKPKYVMLLRKCKEKQFFVDTTL